MKKLTKKKKKKSFFTNIKKTITKELRSKELASFTILEVVFVIIISLLFGVIVGFFINYSKNNTSRDSNLNEIVSTYNDIVNSYYGNINKNELTDAAVRGMIESLEDPYSGYMEGEEADEFNESIDGSFVGIGVMIQQDGDYTTIIEVFDDSPAKKAGLLVGDVIVKVNGDDVKGLDGSKIANLVRGKKGTKVKVTIKRDGKEKEYNFKRDVVDLVSVTDKIIEYDGKNIGYIRIESFAANTYSQFYKSLMALENKKIDSLIIDVRSNPGGHLQQTKQILSLFFDSRTVLYQIKSKNHIEKVYSYSKESRKYPIAVLIDGATASASEVLASCFKENYKKVFIIGNITYGKGTVQKTQTLSNGTTFKYTSEEWLTSKGESINDIGVKPTITVNLSEEFAKNRCDENDDQLKEALNQLKESN
ncbi:MAG: S41 family peptidase [Bacilli bacterium]|nr:S41 family peptidase [Bacilli bacterium]